MVAFRNDLEIVWWDFYNPNLRPLPTTTLSMDTKQHHQNPLDSTTTISGFIQLKQPTTPGPVHQWHTSTPRLQGPPTQWIPVVPIMPKRARNSSSFSDMYQSWKENSIQQPQNTPDQSNTKITHAPMHPFHYLARTSISLPWHPLPWYFDGSLTPTLPPNPTPGSSGLDTVVSRLDIHQMGKSNWHDPPGIHTQWGTDNDTNHTNHLDLHARDVESTQHTLALQLRPAQPA